MSCTQEQIDAVLFAHRVANDGGMPELLRALENAWPELFVHEPEEVIYEPEVELGLDEEEDVESP